MKLNSQQVFEYVAGQSGVTVTQVIQEIDTAIAAAMANPDPAAQKFWSSVPRQGDRPTPAELLTYLADI